MQAPLVLVSGYQIVTVNYKLSVGVLLSKIVYINQQSSEQSLCFFQPELECLRRLCSYEQKRVFKYRTPRLPPLC